MILTVSPSRKLQGRVFLPASKSYSIRAYIIAACGGVSTIIDPSDCDDAKVARAVARALGATIRRCGKNQWQVVAHAQKKLPARILVGESGTALRFVLPLLAARGAQVTVDGRGTLRGRPNAHLVAALRSVGVSITGSGPNHGIPITLTGGSFSGGKITIDGSLSSQFISALLIACPQLLQDTQLSLTGKTIVSSDYITMTRQVLARTGVRIDQCAFRKFHISAPQSFRGLRRFVVPSDYGLAAFLMAAAVLVDSRVTLEGHLSDDLIQADGHILSILRKMGARFTKTSRALRIKGPVALRGGKFSLKECPDLVPIVAVMALFAKGTTRLCDIHHARAKESDRISDLRGELLKVGADVRERAGELIIYPQKEYRVDKTLNPHNDHRLAMAFCVLGLKIAVRVKDIECTSKSYPSFVKDFTALGASIRRVRTS